MARSMRLVGLFAGIGGIELGFSRALGPAVETQLLCEWWTPAQRVLATRFPDIDLHPDAVSNIEMGYLYEELIRRFSELSNETAGEHFTPREVIRLMVNLLFVEDRPG